MIDILNISLLSKRYEMKKKEVLFGYWWDACRGDTVLSTEESARQQLGEWGLEQLHL